MIDLCHPDVARLADRAPFAYLAVQTARGPHVTPVLFSLSGDRLWLAVPRGTLKARVLARRPGVGALIDGGGECLVVRGDVALLDPLRPDRLGAVAPELVRAPVALPSYALRNASELLGFARDAAQDGARSAPHELLLVSVRPESLAFAARPVIGLGAHAQLDAGALAGVPDELVSLARQPGPAVLGWTSPDGPLALPAAWDPERCAVRVPASALAGAGEQTPACVCLDVTHGRGPAAKSGLLLRGPGRVAGDGETVFVEPERVTYWRGFDTGTVDVSTGARA